MEREIALVLQEVGIVVDGCSGFAPAFLNDQRSNAKALEDHCTCFQAGPCA
ncbi:MAG: hypothetical protein ACRYG2_11265 [Janthinobacterium lividum]